MSAGPVRRAVDLPAPCSYSLGKFDGNNITVAADSSSPLNNQAGLPASLDDFIGTWRLNRQISQPNGESFSFSGQATFTWRINQVVYQESGKMRAPNGQVLEADRVYVWQPAPGNRIDVLFDDQRFFHTFCAREPHAEHLCGDDHYVVDYEFAQWPQWQSTWRVTGPRKDYTMVSCYKRG